MIKEFQYVYNFLSRKKKIILFDGECNLCNGFVQFLLRNDSKDVFRFASLRSEIGQTIQAEYNINSCDIDSIVVIDSYTDYKIKSSAVFSVLNDLNRPWSFLSVFKYFPKHINNWLYGFIAKNRYRWFGRKNTCIIMTDDIRHKFL